jgi:peptide/nickel transport system permease protein
MRPPRWPVVVASVALGAMVLLALVAPWLPIPDPSAQDLERQFQAPSSSHWLGTGENGVDILSQALWGARLSLGLGFASVLVSALIGVVLGLFAGYLRGAVDFVLMRAVDVVYSFPGILLAVALAAFLGPSPRNLLLSLVATSWAGYARLARSQALALRERDFVQAARSLGAPTWRVLAFHVCPNVLPFLLVQMTFGLGAVILTESSLSFLGLGSPPGTPSWGQMLFSGREFMTSSPRLVIVPGCALVLTVLSLNLLGDSLRDTLDPKKKR